MKQLDVPTTSLNGELSQNVNIKPTEVVKVSAEKVVKLNKALYGLREAPRCWNGITRIWVGDIIIIGHFGKIIEKLKQALNIKGLGDIKDYLRMEIITKEEIQLKQPKLIEKLSMKFKIWDCKKVNTLMEVNFHFQESSKIINYTLSIINRVFNVFISGKQTGYYTYYFTSQ